jgi:hypothetical protein
MFFMAELARSTCCWNFYCFSLDLAMMMATVAKEYASTMAPIICAIPEYAISRVVTGRISLMPNS